MDSLGLFRSYLLGAMSASMVLAWHVSIPALNGAKLELEPHSIASRDGAFIPFSPPRNELFAHAALFPTFLGKL